MSSKVDQRDCACGDRLNRAICEASDARAGECSDLAGRLLASMLPRRAVIPTPPETLLRVTRDGSSVTNSPGRKPEDFIEILCRFHPRLGQGADTAVAHHAVHESASTPQLR